MPEATVAFNRWKTASPISAAWCSGGILPVRVFGTFESLSRHQKRLRLHPIRVVIGQPYLPSLPADKTEKPSYQLVAQEMMERIAALR